MRTYEVTEMRILLVGFLAALLAETSARAASPPTIMLPAGTTASTFVQAISTPDAVVRLAGNVQIDLSGLEAIPVARGVQILGAPGSMLYTNTFPRTFLLLGEHVRVSGLRVRGAESDDPFSAVGQSDSNGLQIESSPDVEIDHCEVDHWRGAAVAVLDYGDRLDLAHADSVWIHDNFIHHNQHPTADSIIPSGGHGAGYGVQMSHGAYALIERNVFDYNRHNIMGDGTPGTGYLAYRNLILPHGGINSREVGFTIHTHAIDMHGSDTCGIFGGDHNCGLAGEYMDVQYNTVLYTEGASVKLRGTPEIRMNVANNVFASDEDDALVENETGMQAANNAFGLDATSEIRYCDFDGDGVPDKLLATGVTWWYAASTQGGRWVYLYNSINRAGELALGDMNGDGRCDVSVGGTALYMSESGLNPAPAAGAVHGSGLAATRNADGRVELFGANGKSVLRREQGVAGDVDYAAWSLFDGYLGALASATNLDGRVELFGVNPGGSIWHRSQLAAGADAWSPWTQLDGLLVSIAVARNADGRLELFGTNGAGQIWHRWQTAPNAATWSGWQQMDGLLANVAVAANADGRLELFGVNAQGSIFHRWQTAPNAAGWSGWSLLDGLLAQIAVAKNADGRLEIFGTNRAGTVWHRWQLAAGSTAWSSWSAFDDGTLRPGSVAAEANADGRVEIFAVTRVGEVVHRWQVAGGWSAWAHLPGGLAASVPEVRGLAAGDATAALFAAGYAVWAASYVDASCSLAPGFVVLQDPPVGPAVIFSHAPVPPVTIWVSELPDGSACNG